MRPERDLVLGDRYVLTRPIAVGGMGEVWEGADLLLSRRVAVKILKDELRTTPAFIQRFRAEARHAASLGHPGIATVYDYGETADVAYLVMELVPGRTLSELLVEQPDLPTATKLSILSQTAEALHAAHRAGVIHRDVKPANLIVAADGTVKVTDFGIARAIGAAPLTEAGQVFGTAHYMSPEQATGNQVTSASDIYSLGVVAYEMFAGRRPFEAETPVAVSTAHIHSPVPPLPPVVPRGVADLIMEALAKDPASRPASAEMFALRARREMSDDRPAPTLTMPATATASTTRASAQPPPARTGGASGDGTADSDGMRRPAMAALLVFLALVVLIAGGVWLFAATLGTDNSSDGSLGSDTTATTEPPPSTTLDTSAPPSTAAATVAPATATPTTATPTTATPTTATPTTATPTTATPTTGAPVTTVPVSTSATVAATTTLPPPPTTADTPITAAPVLTPTPALGPADEDEVLAFVLTYYEQVNADEFDASWPTLTQEFRDARNLTFESYARYWRNTSLELDDLRYTPGPGPNEGRVRFAARYDTFGRIVEETDELTLRREQDGRLVITEQRIVS